MSNIFNTDFQDFLKTLNNNEVEYILVGGYELLYMDILEQQATWTFGLTEPKKTILN